MGIELGVLLAYTAAAAIVAGGTIYASNRSSSAAAKRQNKLLDAQTEAVREAETKVAKADDIASQEATHKLKKRKLMHTKTILTSPLGIDEQANVAKKTLLGGGAG